MSAHRALKIGLALFNGMILAGIVLVMLRRHAPIPAVADSPHGDAPSIMPHFALRDCQGHPVTEASYRGKVLLVYFGYSYCPDVCPTELGNQARLLRALGADAQRVVPLFITIDPDRDTPSHLASYVALFDPRIKGLTGSAEAIKQAADAFGAWYQRATPTGLGTPGSSAPAATTSDSPGFYLMDHSSVTYLVDRSGHARGSIDAKDHLDDALALIRSCW